MIAGYITKWFIMAGGCPEFLKGGPISLGSLKIGHQILKGGVQYINLTNLTYLYAKE